MNGYRGLAERWCTLIVCSINMGFLLTSVRLDAWLVNQVHEDRGHDTEFKYWHMESVETFGVWSVCDRDNKQRCIDSLTFLQMVNGLQVAPVWLNSTRFFIVLSLLVQGYTCIAALHTLVNRGETFYVVHFVNPVGLVLQTIPLVFVIPDGKCRYLSHFEWDTSYFIAWVGAIIGFLTTFLSIIYNIRTRKLFRM